VDDAAAHERSSDYNWYGDAQPSWHEDDAPWKADHVAAILASHDLAPASVCDIGCGTGGVLDHLVSTLPHITTAVGYEVSARAVALAPTARAARIELVVGALDDGRCFDVALVLDVIEHVEDHRGLLALVRPKAEWFVLHIPLDRSVAATLRPGQYERLRRLMGHIHSFTRRTALATLDTAGFDVIDARYTQPAVDRPTTGLQRIVRLPRRVGFRVAPNFTARVLGGFSLLVLARPRPA
jgi:SAM-dependent methyltransferase